MKLIDAAARLEAIGNPTGLSIYRTLVRAGAAGALGKTFAGLLARHRIAMEAGFRVRAIASDGSTLLVSTADRRSNVLPRSAS